MNGVHDLGGMHGFGPIDPEPNEPVFHHDWERRVFGIMIATFGGGHYNVDQFRYAIERMGPVEYLTGSYYEHWLSSLETLLTERGAITQAELDARREQLSKEAR
jgi:nitrile hydratase beta subunit-like protein